jgi:hypothetical protein
MEKPKDKIQIAILPELQIFLLGLYVKLMASSSAPQLALP